MKKHDGPYRPVMAAALAGLTTLVLMLAGLPASGGEQVLVARGQDSERPRGDDSERPRGDDSQRPRGDDSERPRGQSLRA
jgi:hypothetical protein